MPPPTVQPLRVLLSWWPVAIGLVVSHSEASIFAQAPPPVTYKSVLSPNHQKLVKPSRPRAVTNHRSWVSEIQSVFGRGIGLSSIPWPDLLIAEPSLDAEHPRAPLPVAAELAAADEARQVEAIGNGVAGSIEVLA